MTHPELAQLQWVFGATESVLVFTCATIKAKKHAHSLSHHSYQLNCVPLPSDIDNNPSQLHLQDNMDIFQEDLVLFES